MRCRTLLAAAAGASLIVMPAEARDLTIGGRGGALQKAQDQVYITPFAAATGTAVKLSTWTGDLAALQPANGAAFEWDVVLVDGAALLTGCAAGSFDKLDWAALGRDKFQPFATSDCGAGAAVSSLVLAWDRDKLPITPSWSDFWDVARYPGKRGLRRGARSNLEIALMADGVAAGDVYRLLRTDEGVDRAFHKLDQLKPYLVWWSPRTGASQILKSGEVLLSSAENVPVAEANSAGRHFGVQWNGSLTVVEWWAVVKGGPNSAAAGQFIGFASDPARQAALSALLPYGPTVKGAEALVPADVQATLPTAAANATDALLVDEQFWHDNGAKLEQKFDAWVAHS